MYHTCARERSYRLRGRQTAYNAALIDKWRPQPWVRTTLSFTDAQTLSGPIALQTDVCVVGAGAAGITLALALARESRDVLLIESGGFAPDPATQALYDLQCVGYPVRENYMSRARYFRDIWFLRRIGDRRPPSRQKCHQHDHRRSRRHSPLRLRD